MNYQTFRSFRLVCLAEQISFVENLLFAQGFRFVPEPFSPFVRKLEFEPFPLGASLAAYFGYIYIQDRSSMLPPLALNPHQGASVLDMCASPGSKTGFLGQLVGKTGFVLGNEPTHTRLGTLRRNLSVLNLLQCATMSFAGEDIPLGEGFNQNEQDWEFEGWDFIQLDPPCSGWGTVEKNPQVLNLWQGDKVKPLIALQRHLLSKAFALLKDGGKVVYSTCTTNVAENEEQLEFACEKLGFNFVPIVAPQGFDFGEPIMQKFAGALCVPTSADAQGFFVAMLEKPKASNRPLDPLENLTANSPSNKSSEWLTNSSNIQPGDRLNHRPTKSSNKQQARCPEYLAYDAIASELVCAELLPQGRLGVFSNIIHFLPRASEKVLPAKFQWKGFPIGKLQGGKVKINSGLNCLMPELGHNSAFLSIEEPEKIVALISGQSLAVDVPSPEIGLYFKGLPLCRLSVKGKRAMLPPLL